MKLYLKMMALHFSAAMSYKSSFLLMVLGQFLISFASFLAVHFIFMRFDDVSGFTYTDVLLCFSAVLMAYSISECFASGFKYFPSTLSTGAFDRMLLRPAEPLFWVFASKMEFSSVGRLFQALLIMGYAVVGAAVEWSFFKVTVYVLMILGGVCYFIGCYIVYAALCFYTTEGLEFINIFTDGGREFGKYPISIYGEGALKFFTFILPLACSQYYPLMYLLGRVKSPLMGLTPLVTICFLAPCVIFWQASLKHYHSTGS
ncbi:MAG: ABC-2 family transporter protein [Clostridia bacterium]|nr:ABC-2 family transporter protein [Clostridia bacterium]